MSLKISRGRAKLLASSIFALAALAATGTSASAHYTTTRCWGDRCSAVRCDDDGDRCYAIRTYDRDYYGRGYYHGWRGRDRSRWVCDYDGDDCHRVYGRYYRPHVGVTFGWHD